MKLTPNKRLFKKLYPAIKNHFLKFIIKIILFLIKIFDIMNPLQKNYLTDY